MIHKSRPIFSTQFHPEAKGGPLDSSFLFDIYLDSVQKYKNNQLSFHPQRDSRPSPQLVDLLSKERVGVQPTTGMQNVKAAAAAAAAASG
jgi:carbamoyl-phosphate synthase small subunit